MGSGPAALAIDDFDGDGRWDVVTADASGGTLSLLRGQGGGVLGASTQLAVGGTPVAIFAEDLDGDGATDLLWYDQAAGKVLTKRGNGDGTFQGTLTGATAMGDVAGVADFNGDGTPDLAMVVAHVLEIAPGAGDGTFGSLVPVSGTPFLQRARVADLNADGWPDVVATADAEVGGDAKIALMQGLSTGAGSFTWTQLGVWCDEPGCSTILDPLLATRLDNDDFDDVAFGSEFDGTPSDPPSYGVQTWLNAPPTFRGAFGHGPGSASSLVAADFDGDNKVDLAFTRFGQSGVIVLTAAPDGPTARNGEFSGGASAAAVASADMNDDGKPDLVVADQGRSQVRVLLNQGAATGAPAAPRHMRAFPGYQSILVKWRSVLRSGLQGYRVYYGVSGANPPLQGTFASEGASGLLVPASENAFRLHCPVGTRVAVSARAVGPDGKESLASETVGATPSATLGAPDPIGMPTAFALGAPRPNPARQHCDLSFDLPRAAHVGLEVFDVRGRVAARLVDATLPAGRHTARWRTSEVPAGLYFVRISAGPFRDVVRIAVTR